jgi:hypothetical protein
MLHFPVLFYILCLVLLLLGIAHTNTNAERINNSRVATVLELVSISWGTAYMFVFAWDVSSAALTLMHR